MTNLPKLPTGIQTFDRIRTEGRLCVDKTKYLVDLIDEGSIYFLSRPRRFDKSVTISTLEARLDMSKPVTNRGVEPLLESMTLLVTKIARSHAEHIPELALRDPSTALGELINLVAEKERKRVVVLVDEYDKPVLDNMHDPDEAEAARRVLRGFYVQIKAADSDITLKFRNQVWVVEVKIAKKGEDVGKAADEALQQIIDKGYAERFADAVMLGVAIDDERRTIGEYRVQM